MTDEIPASTPDATDIDTDDALVLPESAVDDVLDTVRTGAEEYEDAVYAAGVVKGAEQFHRMLTSLDLSSDTDERRPR